MYCREEVGLLGSASDLHPLESAVQPHVDVQVTGVFMEMQKRPRPAREESALALPQLRERAQPSKQTLDAIKVVVSCVPHVLSMTADAGDRQLSEGRRHLTSNHANPGSVDDSPGLATEYLGDGLGRGHL